MSSRIWHSDGPEGMARAVVSVQICWEAGLWKSTGLQASSKSLRSTSVMGPASREVSWRRITHNRHWQQSRLGTPIFPKWKLLRTLSNLMLAKSLTTILDLIMSAVETSWELSKPACLRTLHLSQASAWTQSRTAKLDCKARLRKNHNADCKARRETDLGELTSRRTQPENCDVERSANPSQWLTNYTKEISIKKNRCNKYIKKQQKKGG